MKPLLSIAIATKNREKYCISAIESILNYNDNRLQITIADNSETTLVKEYVEYINSPQIKYKYDSSPISSIDNFNCAIELTDGEYVILIGDDDSVHEKIIDVVKWMKANDIDTAASRDTFTFLWPGAHPDYPNGYLTIPEVKNSYTIVNPQQEILRLLNYGLVNYFYFKVPKSYHGIVKKDFLEKIRNKTGNYYGALSPDIFSVVSLSLIVTKHAVLDYPVSIAGVCATSTTSDQIKGKHSGDLKDMPHLKNRKEPYIWDKLVPEIYSVPTTWADSGLNALNAMGRSDLRKNFNYYPLVAHTILINRKAFFKFSIEKCDEFRKKMNKNYFVFWTNVIFQVFKLSLDKFFRFYIQKNNNACYKYESVSNFEEVFSKINSLDLFTDINKIINK